MPGVNAEMDIEDSHHSPVISHLPFPPITKAHILHCSYHFWHPIYRTITPKARLIRLTPAFLSYLRADGIILPSSPPLSPSISTDSGIFSSASSSSSSSSTNSDPSSEWPEIHAKIASTIAELGGSVVPKLNWSAPKDATWIAVTNSMECVSPEDVYLLLKSSDFITHDLEQAFDGCVDALGEPGSAEDKDEEIPYHLILRKTIPSLITSLEYRCFVRQRKLLCICQRDLNHYPFLSSLRPILKSLIQTFFDQKLKSTFPDEDFVFDVYVPQPKEKGRVWLIDINPWAPRTDPLLFAWMEIMDMEDPRSATEESFSSLLETGILRVSLGGHDRGLSIQATDTPHAETLSSADNDNDDTESDESNKGDDDEEDEETLPSGPEFRLVNRDDPEAYSFSTPQYSAHKLPKDVLDASADVGVDGEGGLRDFMAQWRDILARQEQEREGDGDDEDGEKPVT